MRRPADITNYARLRDTPSLAGLLAALALATVAHALASTVRRRRRDLAVLKTLSVVDLTGVGAPNSAGS